MLYIIVKVCRCQLIQSFCGQGLSVTRVLLEKLTIACEHFFSHSAQN